ncbi:MAG: hypothetical protein ACE14P_10575 [Methanotrichaceae archaeon]
MVIIIEGEKFNAAQAIKLIKSRGGSTLVPLEIGNGMVKFAGRNLSTFQDVVEGDCTLGEYSEINKKLRSSALGS